jgi:hypothetical protein
MAEMHLSGALLDKNARFPVSGRSPRSKGLGSLPLYARDPHVGFRFASTAYADRAFPSIGADVA